MRPVQMALAALAGLMTIPVLAATNPTTLDPAARAAAAKLDAERAKPPPGTRVRIDHSGRKESGTATWYGPHRGRGRTASGKRLTANAHVAASKTLPLGTTAKV